MCRKEDWVNVKWQPGTISHNCQKDGTSCGVFVMEMARMVMKEFPNIPKSFRIPSSQKSIRNLRRAMAQEILQRSVSKAEFCSFCGEEDLPKPIDAAGGTDWVRLYLSLYFLVVAL
ncbi:hypothetical protein N1851_029230 [Merluccius polli]|uniref:Ubiquitin-like protease family profile domain-containing protein n=1 Tax=Merluccius polli TaxID=89951 RepID=A0AA47NQW2_MERPO|nr:hypothetical protein N1851_029230 [Merluccius polli]